MDISLGGSLFDMKTLTKQSTPLQGIEPVLLNCLAISVVTIKSGTYKGKCMLTKMKESRQTSVWSNTVFSRPLGIWKFITVYQFVDRILSWINPLRIFSRQHFNIVFKIILKTMQRPKSCSLPFTFSNYKFLLISHLFYLCVVSNPRNFKNGVQNKLNPVETADVYCSRTSVQSVR